MIRRSALAVLWLTGALTLASTQPASALTCESLFKSNSEEYNIPVIDVQPNIIGHINPGQNIINKSLWTSVPAAVAWLGVMEGFRLKESGLGPHSWDLTVFALNTSIDVVLTLVSHTIAVGKVPYLSRFFAGQPRTHLDSAKRVGMNVALSTSIIYGIWSARSILGFGEMPTAEHLAVAAGLTTLVYPALQLLKENLFIKGPKRKEKNYVQEQREVIQEYFSDINSKMTRFKGLPKESKLNAKDFVVSAAEAYVTSITYEKTLSGIYPLATLKKLGLAKIISEIDGLRDQVHILGVSKEKESKEYGKVTYQLMNKRRKLINKLIALVNKKNQNPEVREQLIGILGNSLYNRVPGNVLEFHVKLKEYSGKTWPRLLSLSLVDMGVSVGFAGGILLYGVNGWMVSGLPFNLVNLVNFML